MNRLLTLLFTLLLFSCTGDKNVEEIVYEFYPSYMPPIQYKINIAEKTLLQESKLYDIEGYIQGSAKLVNEEYKIDKKVLDVFLAEIQSAQIENSINHSQEVLHGIGLRFSKIDKSNDSISLISTSPRRTKEFLMDYKILDAFFELTDKTVKNHYRGQSLTENIKDYYDYGLPVKKTRQEPLEYRVWGRVSGCRESNPGLVDLLDSLPNNKPIIFDLRNGEFASCLSELLEEYEKEKHIYYYGNFELTQIEMEVEILKEQLHMAEKDNSKGQVGDIRVSLKGYTQDQKNIIEKIDSDSIKFKTKDELLKTIANNG